MPVVGLATTLRLGALFALAALLAASGPAGAASDVLVPAKTPFGYNVGIDYETDVDGRTGRSITADLNQITQYFGLLRTYHDTANPNSATPIIDPNELQVIQYAMTHPAMNLVIGTYNSALVTGNTGNFCGVASGSFSAGLMDSSVYTDAWVQMLIGAFGGSTAAVQQSVKTILLGNEPDLPGTFMPGPGDPNYSNYVNTWIPNAVANLKNSLSNAGLGNIPISVTLAFSPVSDSIPCPGSNTVSKAIPQYISSHWSASWNGGQPFVLYNQYSNSSPPTFNDITGYMQQVVGSLNGSNEAFVGETGVQSPGGNDSQEAAFYQGMFAFLGNEQQNYGRTLPVFAFQAFDLPAFNQTYGLFSQDANFQPTGLKSGIAVTSFQLFALSVTVSGGGTVTSNPAGINCGSTCGASFTSGTQVALSASPNPGFTFSGWSGACSGTGSCTVTMNAAESVTATFAQVFTLSATVSGSGTVTSSPSGISCPSSCSANFAPGTQVTLTAAPASGWKFNGWSGACSGTGTCSVTMNSAQSVTATFVQLTYMLAVSLTGSGSVTSNPLGISCPSACSASFNSAVQVTLTATPAQGMSFIGWSGACTGTGGCSVTMSATEGVSAAFTTNGDPSNSRTWVSAASGSDSNPCTRTSPCLTFATALTQTSAGGEINVLDPGDFGPVTITKAITIFGNAAGGAGMTPTPGTSGIVISAGASDVIHLDGLVFDGATSGTSGVVFTSGARLNVDQCVFQGFTTSGMTLSPGVGGANTTLITVQNTTILDNATGILIRPTGGIAASVRLRRVRIDHNTGEGLRVDGTGGSGAVNVAIADSTANFNASNGIDAVSGPGNATVDIMRVVAAANGAAGIQSNQASGGTASVTVGSSMLRSNAIGVQVVGGASLLSYGNNHVTGNASNGSFTGGATLH